MSKKKNLLAAARLVMPTIGLCLICGGAYIKSIQGDDMQMLRDVITFFLIVLGFVLLFIGVLWSLGHGMKNAMVKWSGRRTQDNEVHVFTVDRATFYPPSYEESQVRDNVGESVDIWWPGVAPPVYSEICCETSNEDFSHEEPPSYQQAILQSQAFIQNPCAPPYSTAEPVVASLDSGLVSESRPLSEGRTSESSRQF
ncbi:transmembrane protein 252-like [Hoplias malabaricus]|uniref:transmembrane protein 252-like n=1 Tax=Hoplias malabaricus TaxID=27720 RepID=UPI0034623E33